MMNRSALRALAFDIICIFVFVVIGTRNHKTDTGLSGVLFVAAPFLISVIGSRIFMRIQKRDVFSVENGVTVVLFTTAIGLLLRRFVFDRGTATAFVIVATVFLFTTMLGWRFIVARRSAA